MSECGRRPGSAMRLPYIGSPHFSPSSPELVMRLARLLLCLSLFAAVGAFAQVVPTRTWPELKDAVQDRVNRNAYPLAGYDAAEVREVLARIQSLDRDEWARSWMQQGDKHLAEAKAAQSAGDRAKA